ncbi:hypothetical protein BCE_2309 [Bacillus cereus ATCC 10987]|uniref:Uncharacterized protein n=1 Tax=Bacillus cereus (strain ATCC 10987 / NRS 248) TaxID=222523 RepID=Q738T4_BACC1|nr:hypothetical protein BCE_2309 [Bacillus cereus ATCC 10987]
MSFSHLLFFLFIAQYAIASFSFKMVIRFFC